MSPLRDRLELVGRTLNIVEWDLRLLRKAAVEAVCLVDQDPDAFVDPSLREPMGDYMRALIVLALMRGAGQDNAPQVGAGHREERKPAG